MPQCYWLLRNQFNKEWYILRKSILVVFGKNTGSTKSTKNVRGWLSWFLFTWGEKTISQKQAWNGNYSIHTMFYVIYFLWCIFLIMNAYIEIFFRTCNIFNHKFINISVNGLIKKEKVKLRNRFFYPRCLGFQKWNILS